MKLFKASFDTILIRYYLVMILAIVPFFIGIPQLAILAVPVFLSALLGISFPKILDKKFEKSSSQLNPVVKSPLLQSA